MRHHLAVACLAPVLVLAGTYISPPAQEISRERAIEIARQRISFQPDNVRARRATAGARPVWRVTFRGRLPGQPSGLFETAIIEVDRRSGAVVSIARP